MFRFRVGPIPVLVHASHLIISALLAWQFTQSASGTSWPATALNNENHPAHLATFGLVLALWVGIIFFSVLIHELGHALTSLSFGYNAVIEMVGMGGVTRQLAKRPGQNLEMPWHHELFIVAAGPLSGLGLGLFAGVLLLIGGLVGHLPDGVDYVLRGVFAANVFWALVNLVPVTPLDGGALSRVVLMRLFGRVGFLLAQALTVLVAGAAIAFGLYEGAVVLSVLFSLYLFRAMGLIIAYLRGDVLSGPAAHPLHATLARAEALVLQGEVDEPERVARAVVDGRAPASLKARANAVLGLVQLKRGDGRRALSCFKVAGERAVPPFAMATAYSLAGDEASALPYFERAAASGDAKFRHEYAGALIRAGQEAEARRLPEVRLALAYAAAQRVFSVRGEHARAAAMAEEAFQAEPSAKAAYDAASEHARANDPNAAMRCLTLASQNGYRDAAAARADEHLAALRGRPEFEAWLESLAERLSG